MPPYSDPLAYLLTWTTYGTWLPGDDRGWVDFQQGEKPPSKLLSRDSAKRLSESPCRLDRTQRALVETTIREHCSVRQWAVHAVSCRSNHVHVVVAGLAAAETMRDQLKAWCTRKLREQSSAMNRQKWWTERGSLRAIYDDVSLAAAIEYVCEAQDRKGRDEQC